MGRAPLLVALVAVFLCAWGVSGNSDTTLDGPEIIRGMGFPCETHFVTTSDGYILRLFRIPNAAGATRGSVILQHGVLDSSDTWIMNNRQESLAFILADSKYDVWLANSRGNKYSRNHTQPFDPNWPFDASFWDFSFDDMASKDLPAVVKYVQQNGHGDIQAVVGHSQGTTLTFANLANTDPSINIAHLGVPRFIALAPVVHLTHCKSLLIQALTHFDIDKLVALLGVHEFLPSSKILELLIPDVCKATPGICDSVIYLFAGLDPKNLNNSRLPFYTAHFPSGTSVKDMEHWAQYVRAFPFDYYDYGLIGNEIHYHKSSPPMHDLSNLKDLGIAVSIFHGGDDDLADPTDVSKLLSELDSYSKAIVTYRQYLPGYDHLDFVWGENANTDVYLQLMIELEK